MESLLRSGTALLFAVGTQAQPVNRFGTFSWVGESGGTRFEIVEHQGTDSPKYSGTVRLSGDHQPRSLIRAAFNYETQLFSASYVDGRGRTNQVRLRYLRAEGTNAVLAMDEVRGRELWFCYSRRPDPLRPLREPFEP